MKQITMDPSPVLLRLRRKLAGYTLRDVGKLTGKNPKNISDHENGKHTPNSKSLSIYAKLYECDIDDFYEIDIPRIKNLATAVIADYFYDSGYSKDRKAQVASHLLTQLPEPPQTEAEQTQGETYPDFWRSLDLHAYSSENAKAVINYTGHELVVSGPTRVSKTLRILEYILYLHFTYPGFKSLVVRSDAVDLTSTIRASLKELLKYDLDDPLSPIKVRGGFDDFHTLKINGGEMVLGGMNRPGRVMGTKYDLVFYSQIEHSDEEQYQKLKTRVSGDAGNWIEDGKRRYLFIGDANPDRSDHYLLERKRQGKLDWIDFGFEDNPLYFRSGARTPEWSIVDELDQGLVGIWHDRYFKGLWRSPEGAVYTIEKENIVDALPDLSECTLYRACDWGQSHPSICLWIAEHKETGDVTVYREWRKTHSDILEMGNQVKAFSQGEDIEATVIDHDENRQILLQNECDIPSVMAYKSAGSVMDGIFLMQSALRKAVEGKPGGLYFYDNLLCNADPNPDVDPNLNLIKEMEGLEFDPKQDKPIKERDDAADALRYWFLFRLRNTFDFPAIMAPVANIDRSGRVFGV